MASRFTLRPDASVISPLRATELPPDVPGEPLYRPPQPGIPGEPPVGPISDPPVLPPDDPGTPSPIPSPITL